MGDNWNSVNNLKRLTNQAMYLIFNAVLKFRVMAHQLCLITTLADCRKHNTLSVTTHSPCEQDETIAYSASHLEPLTNVQNSFQFQTDYLIIPISAVLFASSYIPSMK